MTKKSVSVLRVDRSAEKLNEILVENFVNLQKAITNLTVRFEDMSSQISKLLQLFEISARSFSEKLSTVVPEIEKDREFLDKLNKLLEQNKVIAKGITLMEEKIRERVSNKVNLAQPQQQAPHAFRPQGYMPSSMSIPRVQENDQA